MFSKRVLVVDDDEAIAESICDVLSGQGDPSFSVRYCLDGLSGLRLCLRWRPDVLVLDLGLPELPGERVLEAVRNECRHTKVCVVSGRDGLEDRVELLGRGADDYLVKPFSARELAARIIALTRRDCLSSGVGSLSPGVSFAADGRVRSAAGGEVRLSRTEAALLRYLMERAGRAVSRSELLDTVWGGKDRYPNVVDATVENLRAKLRLLSPLGYLHTAYRSGYFFEAAPVRANSDVFRAGS